MKRIIVATDFSEASVFAVESARRIASRTGAALVLIHASNVTGALPDHFELSSGKLEPYRRELRNQLGRARSQLDELRGRLADTLEVTAQVIDGHPEEAIARVAEEDGVDLVVTGTRAKGNLFLGSVAERVARSCSRPVLIARRPMVGERGFENILCATDFEPQADRTAELAALLAAPGAQLELLHSWNIGRAADSLTGLLRSEEYGALRKQGVAAAYRRGHALCDRIGGRGLVVRFAVRDGAPAHTIIERAEEADPPLDLIAVGSHGRRGWERFVLGSVAESIVRYAPCSVLVAR